MFKNRTIRLATIVILVVLAIFLIYRGWLSSKFKYEPPPDIHAQLKDVNIDSVVNLVLISEIGNAGFDFVSDFPVNTPLNLEPDSFYSLIKRADSLRLPVASAFYYYQLAEITGNDSFYFNSGRYYFAGSEVQTQNHLKSVLLKKAVQCFDKVLKSDPDSDDATVLKAAAMLQDNQPPMNSIGILLAYEERFPENEKVLYMLAELSAESQQWDKAEKRIKKLISLHPSKPDYYFLMSEVFTRQSMKDSAKLYLDKGISLSGKKTF